MSMQSVTWAYTQQAPSSSAKFLLVTLANYADDEGRCWPKIETLMKDTHLSKRGLIYAIGKLEKCGLIKRIHRAGNGSGRKSNVYELQMQSAIYAPDFEVQSMHLGVGQSAQDAPISKVHKLHLAGGKVQNLQGKVQNTSYNARLQDEPPIEPSIEEKNGNAPIASARTAREGQRRLQPDWNPGDRAKQWIETHGLTVDQAQPAIVEFREYWLQRTTRRKDWDLAFMRNGLVQSALLRIAKHETHNRPVKRNNGAAFIERELESLFEENTERKVDGVVVCESEGDLRQSLDESVGQRPGVASSIEPVGARSGRAYG